MKKFLKYGLIAGAGVLVAAGVVIGLGCNKVFKAKRVDEGEIDEDLEDESLDDCDGDCDNCGCCSAVVHIKTAPQPGMKN